MKTEETPNSLPRELKNCKTRGFIGYFLIGFSIASLLLTFTPIGFYSLIIFAVLLIIGILLSSSAKSKAKTLLADQLIPQVLSETFDNVHYDSNNYIDVDEILLAEKDFPFQFDEIRGSDLIEADYHGVHLTMSDIHIFEERTEYNETNKTYEKKEVSIFNGLWLICDFQKRLASDLILISRQGILSKMKKGIKTENEVFNNTYYIEAENEHDAFYLLTPHMMEFILNTIDTQDGRVYLRFNTEGKVTIAIDSGRDAFELHHLDEVDDLEALKTRFNNEIHEVTDIIDGLRLSDNFFRRES